MKTSKLLLGAALFTLPLGACGMVTEIEDGTTGGTGGGNAGAAQTGGLGGGSAGTPSGGSSGGGAAGGTAGAGGSAGAGGAVDCTSLQRAGEVVKVASPSGDNQHPRLVGLGSSVELVHASVGASTKGIVKARWHAPWTDPWSAPGPGAAVIPAAINKPYATAANSKQTTPAVLHGVVGVGCLRLATIDPQDTIAHIGDCATTPMPPAIDMGLPRLVVPGPASGTAETYLVGYEMDPHQLFFSSVSAGMPSPPWSLGCATASLHAQGWYSPGGTLVAFSTSRPFNGCMLDVYTDGPPTRLQIVRLGDGVDPFYANLQHELELGAPIIALHLARRTDGGAWLVFQTDGGEAPGPIQALALDAEGKPISGVLSVEDPLTTPPFAVAPLGNSALLVWSACATPPCEMLRFKLIDENVELTTPPIHLEPLPWPPPGELSLVSSPDASSVIAAWSDIKALPSDIWAAKFDCMK
jgi:hypothetical protein